MARKFRHGDILLTEVEKLPEGKITKTDDKLEMHGETGKIHQLLGVKVVEINYNKIFVEVMAKGATMTHPEHPPLVLPPMLAQVTRVRSVTPYID